jgi:hypothetical protein
MPEYLIYFNQQWVGEHTEEWFSERGPLAMAVTAEMRAAGVYVFAGGLEEEDGPVYSADPTSGTGSALQAVAARGQRSMNRSIASG